MPGMQGHSGTANLDCGRRGHYIGRSMDGNEGKPREDPGTRAGRLARALRENLRRRKAQARERAAGATAGERDDGADKDND